MQLKKENKVKNGIILIYRHPTGGLIVDTDILAINWFPGLEQYSFKFERLAGGMQTFRYMLHHRNEGNPFYILRPMLPKMDFTTLLYNENICKNIVHVEIDEGLATYIRGWSGWIVADIKGKKWNELWKLFNEWTWKKAVFTLLLKSRKELIKNTLFVKKGKNLVNNRKLIIHFKRVFDKLGQAYDLSAYEKYSHSIIICTQPYGEQNDIMQNDDVRIIKKFCEIAHDMGFFVILKPHPREKNTNRYKDAKCFIDSNNSVPLEALLAGIHPKPVAVIGITTTTLVTAKLFWNIPTISLAKLISREAYAYGIRDEVDNFCDIFRDIVQIPEKFQDILV